MQQVAHSSRLKEIQSRMLENKDQASAEKIGQLEEKLGSGKASIALSGHFSAGKSSLINALCGRKLLPSGPIPTSANLVVIENGEEGAYVVRGSSKGGKEAGEHIALEELADYCKDGEAYKRIDIRYPSELLSSKLRLLDTPGVDSTDDAHMQATEASLHLADAVFYITDYNHVLSELNLSFTKRLKDSGKPLYLIVNQVDKHRESELSFDAYKKNVMDVFQSWGVKPDGYLFVSVKDPGHPNSEWGKLLWLIGQLKERSEELLRSSVRYSAMTVIREHVSFLFPDSEQPGLEMAASEAEARLKELEERSEAILGQPEALQEQFRLAVNKLIEAAPIMPATTRDLASAYLQSRKPGFKVGLFFTEAKTKAEIVSRLHAFHGRLFEHVEKQLVWHLNQLLKEFIDKAGLHTANLPEQPLLEAELSEEWLAGLVKESAGFTDEYTMVYCGQAAEAIRSSYRRKAIELFEASVLSVIRERAEQQLVELDTEKSAARALHERTQRDLSKDMDRRSYMSALLGVLNNNDADTMLQSRWPDPIAAPSDLPTGAHLKGAEQERTAPALPLSSDPAMQDAAEENEGFHYGTLMERMAHTLDDGAEQLANIPSLAKVRESLLERAGKLRNNRFTVALFGAFSAGKSSFANALIGEPVLPVSPNPTTAAINAILPPDEKQAHRTALIRMKSEKALLDDIRFSLSMLGLEADGVSDIAGAVKRVEKLKVEQVPAKGKPHISFIRAVEHGWQQVHSLLGTSWTADFDTYRSFVSEESKSCFVESIDLHYDTDFGKQGVVFVDTPGADSIHARHTGVTFEYIKNADAILFVTYYNHAFSQADKQFLLQLGRVKEAFELDKMFFIVNAADLAESAEELRSVLDYVENQLLQHGIRHPRMFAVSSRSALEAKQAKSQEMLAQSGLAGFERSFARFAENELAAVTLQAADAELRRAAARFGSFIEGMKQDDEQRERYLQELKDILPALAEELRTSMENVSAAPIRQELEELLHHVKQRCYYRFGELYNDAFHPSALQEDGRNMAIALQSAWKQLQQSTAVDVSSELLATTLRMEQFVRAKAIEWSDYAREAISARIPAFIGDEWKSPDFGTPLIEESLGGFRTEERDIRKSFKNAKAFFEGEGKSSLKLLLEADVTAAVQEYVQAHHKRLKEFYEACLHDALRSCYASLTDQVAQFAEQMSQQAESREHLAEYSARLDSIQSYIRK